jgi:hypothetical protein
MAGFVSESFHGAMNRLLLFLLIPQPTRRNPKHKNILYLLSGILMVDSFQHFMAGITSPNQSMARCWPPVQRGAPPLPTRFTHRAPDSRTIGP